MEDGLTATLGAGLRNSPVGEENSFPQESSSNEGKVAGNNKLAYI